MKKEKTESDFLRSDIKNRIMERIKTEKIKIRHPLFWLAQKMGLQSVLALVIFGGAFAVSSSLFCLKKIGALKFLAFGVPGVRIFLMNLPFDYIALIIVAILLANYILKKIYLSACFVPCKVMSLLLFLLVAIIGSIFFIMGIGSAF